jgi:hypothetical protein
MRSRRPAVCVIAFLSLVCLTGQSVQGQGRRGGGPATTGVGDRVERRDADPLAGPVVSGAPFAADATTTVVQTLSDGTRIEQKSTTKFYRDGTGRVRREQTIIGLDTLNPSAGPRTIITLDSVPGDPMPYVLDPVARTARQIPRGIALAGAVGALNGLSLTYFRARTPAGIAADPTDLVLNVQGLSVARRGVPNDLRPAEEQLGSRQIEGVKATGLRTTITIPQGRIGNDRPIQIVDERWDSPELGLLIASRYSDPRTGVVDYKLTNINRTEPRADLFTVPSDYNTVPFGAPGGGRGGRNQGVVPPPATRPPQ